MLSYTTILTETERQKRAQYARKFGYLKTRMTAAKTEKTRLKYRDQILVLIDEAAAESRMPWSQIAQASGLGRETVRRRGSEIRAPLNAKRRQHIPSCANGCPQKIYAQAICKSCWDKTRIQAKECVASS